MFKTPPLKVAFIDDSIWKDSPMPMTLPPGMSRAEALRRLNAPEIKGARGGKFSAQGTPTASWGNTDEFGGKLSDHSAQMKRRPSPFVGAGTGMYPELEDYPESNPKTVGFQYWTPAHQRADRYFWNMLAVVLLIAIALIVGAVFFAGPAKAQSVTTTCKAYGYGAAVQCVTTGVQPSAPPVNPGCKTIGIIDGQTGATRYVAVDCK